ncbi:6-bladed beta-propeller [Gemmatimonas groenlandica]|uniref:6-bladed beta-propeller n=1 Tax=Gemmatimonas groenlandica TaxID=2732249 RepID=A0A6M4IQ63_9BACT|nr:6-bladed beta-propeller [Gemmatimonas groenlandica]QJR34421.1 6-bladed beta-propeller [Gemmatimonas groenlandica]
MPLTPRLSHRAFAGIILALVVSAPDSSTAVHAQQSPTIRRFRADSFYIREWVRGGTKDPDLLVEPRSLAVTEHVVVVLDAGTREIHAFDLTTGAKRFVLNATGEGPGEFKRPMQIVASARHVGVLDAATSRLTVYSDSGRFLWTTRVPDGPVVETICLLPRGLIRVKYLGATRAIAMIDSSGRTLSRTSLPVVTALQKAPSFANSAYIADGCAGESMAVAPFFGGSWYSISSSGAAKRFSYIEAGDEAVVVTKQRRLERTATHVTTQTTMTTEVSPIARGAMQRGDTVIIEAGATKTYPHQLLDYYRASDGAYLYSRRLPFTPTALAIAPDGRLFAASIGTETSLVVALSTTPLSPRDIAKQKQRK